MAAALGASPTAALEHDEADQPDGHHPASAVRVPSRPPATSVMPKASA